MSKITRLGVLILSAFVFLPILTWNKGSAEGAWQKNMNYLVAGMDDAAENTDVLSIVNLNSSDGRLTYIQIPRDTYCNIDVYRNKINHIYSTARANGMTAKESMDRLSSFIEETFSIKLDGYVAVSQSAFRELIDGIGGVYVTLDDEIAVDDGAGRKFKKGENHLGSDDALYLIRYRHGYARGDLDRLDVQKSFIRGLIKTVAEKQAERPCCELR